MKTQNKKILFKQNPHVKISNDVIECKVNSPKFHASSGRYNYEVSFPVKVYFSRKLAGEIFHNLLVIDIQLILKHH